MDLVTGFDTILTSRQTREKLRCLYENLISNNFRKTAVLKKNIICKLKLHSRGFYWKHLSALHALEDLEPLFKFLILFWEEKPLNVSLWQSTLTSTSRLFSYNTWIGNPKFNVSLARVRVIESRLYTKKLDNHRNFFCCLCNVYDLVTLLKYKQIV